MPTTEIQTKMLNTFLIEEENASKESILKRINFIIGNQSQLIENCMDLLDDSTKQIKRIKSASTERIFWKVPSQSYRGGLKKDYICTEKYCPCRSFGELAKSNRSDVLCKHLLAIRIGTALKVIIEQVVTDVVFVDMMCE